MDKILNNYGKNITSAEWIWQTSWDISTTQYGKIERGEQNLDCQGLTKLCQFMDCKPERVLFGERESREMLPPNYFSSYTEKEKRLRFRSLYILLGCHRLDATPTFHKMFGSDFLLEISSQEKNVIPFVLEHERKAMNLTRRNMSDFLGISKNMYYSLIEGETLSNTFSLISISEKLHYDMTFLLMNKVRYELFLWGISPTWSALEQNLFEHQLDLCLALEKSSDAFMEIQKKRLTEPN